MSDETATDETEEPPFVLREEIDEQAGVVRMTRARLRQPAPGAPPIVFHFGQFLVTVHAEGCALVLPPPIVQTVRSFHGDNDRAVCPWPDDPEDKAIEAAERIARESIAHVPKEWVREASE